MCGDEAHFVETVRFFGAGVTWEKVRTYEEMSTPLPFLVSAAWGQQLGFDLPTLRWGNCLAGWLACLAVFRLAGAAGLGRGPRWLLAGWFAALPYTLYLSAFVHTDMLSILALACGLTGAVRRRWVSAGVWLAAALLCRQYLVFVPVGIAGAALWRGRADRRAAAGALPAAGLALAPLAALCAYWGGPQPANRLHTLYTGSGFAYHPDSLVVYLALVPVYLAPYFVREFVRSLPNRSEPAVGVLVGAVVTFVPLSVSRVSSVVGIETIGLFHRFVRALGGAP